MKSNIETSPVQDYLANLHSQFAGLTEGAVATYIPELAKANPSLEAGTGRPLNPMINAGAIASTSLIAGETPELKVKNILNTFSLFAGSQLTIDADVYQSESRTGHRNRAIGYMLRNFGILADDPNPIVETYFQQCAISVTCRNLGLMAATLANRGINPVSGKRAIRGEYVENILSIMGSCGMYDAAGEWMYTVGMPAKSGVAGGIIAVLPGHLGVGVFSPPLNSWGNSVRGIQVCDSLSRHCDLHLFNRASASASAIRLKASGADFSSNRSRPADQCSRLRQFGSRIQVYQLQGELSFATTETVIRDVIDGLEAMDFLVFDMRRVLTLSESACWLFSELLAKVQKRGKAIVFSHIQRVPLLRRYMTARLGAQRELLFRAADDNDMALEWCENALLASLTAPHEVTGIPSSLTYELCQDFDPDEQSIFAASLRRRHYRSGEIIIQIADPAYDMFFLTKGEVSVILFMEDGTLKRLAAMGPGMTFGEMAVIDGSPRSATVVADSVVECDVITANDLEQLGRRFPEIRIKLLKNLTISLTRRLRSANRELGLLR